jgi:DsbC/DsbD-like thiol-disulfide interchange protein
MAVFSRTRLLVAAFLVVPSGCFAQVQMTVEAADSSAQPGKPTMVALRLNHMTGWHTYWVNPGTGAPTTAAWTLPSGWTAGPIQWPTPIAIKNQLGEVAGNGFEGTLYLPVELQVPADAAAGSTLIKVHARWLMCAESCIPGHADAALEIKVASAAPAPNVATRAAITRQAMPQPHPEWTVAANRSGSSLILSISGASSLKSSHFFSEDGLIRTDASQAIQANGTALVLTLAVSNKAPTTDTLRGVLAYTDDAGVYRGAQLRIPISSNH